jgi:hypothetical protein
MIQFGAVYDLSLNEWIKPEKRVMVTFTTKAKRYEPNLKVHLLLTGVEKDEYLGISAAHPVGKGKTFCAANAFQDFYAKLLPKVIKQVSQIKPEDCRELKVGIVPHQNSLIDLLPNMRPES